MYEINFKFQSLAGGLAHFSNEHIIVLMGFLRGAGGGGGRGWTHMTGQTRLHMSSPEDTDFIL